MALQFLAQATLAQFLPVLDSATNRANGHIYYLLAEDSWTTSEATAMAMGGHLATVRNDAENKWLYDTFAHKTNDASHNLWIGLNDAAQEGVFVWASGEPLTYTNWAVGEPNNAIGDENYVEMWGNDADIARYPYWRSPGTWNDSNDSVHSRGETAFGVVEVVPSFLKVPVALSWERRTNVWLVSWPEDHRGWHLQIQTNAPGLGLGTNWITLDGSDLITEYPLPPRLESGSIFLRLTYP